MKLSHDGKRRIGGTAAAKLLGVSPYGNASDVYAEVALGIEVAPNAAMNRGSAYEALVRQAYRAAEGVQCMEWVTQPVVLEHDRYAWATCSPDDVTVDLRLVEYKTVNSWARSSWDDAPPISYTLQVLWNMWVGDLRDGHLYAAFGEDVGSEFRIDGFRLYRFERDAEMERTFAEVGGDFWARHVVARRPPPMAPMKAKRKFKQAVNAAPTAAPTNEANQ